MNTPAKTFSAMFDNKEVKKRLAYQILLDDVHEEPGFNLRQEGEELEDSINLLSQFIMEGGKVPPVEVRPRAEGGAWIVDGHRRIRAYHKARFLGFAVDWIPVETFTGEEAQRVARIITSQEGKPLTQLEMAAGFKRLADSGLSTADIAKLVNKTRQQVENLLVLQNAPEEVREMVKEGVVSATVAVQETRKHKDKAPEKIKEKMHAAKTTGKKKGKVTAAAIKGKKIPVELYEKLYYCVDKMLNGNDSEMRELQAAHAAIADLKG